MKTGADKFHDEYMPFGPQSVFYRGKGRRRQRQYFFNKTHETQARIEQRRYRQQRKGK